MMSMEECLVWEGPDLSVTCPSMRDDETVLQTSSCSRSGLAQYGGEELLGRERAGSKLRVCKRAIVL